MESEESRPIYESAIVPIRIKGTTYHRQQLHFNATVLPLVMAGLIDAAEWDLAEYPSGWCVLNGPLFAASSDTARERMNRAFGSTPESP